MLSVKEVASLLNVEPRTVRKWIVDGKLVAYQFGDRGYSIEEKDLEQFKQSCLVRKEVKENEENK